MARLAVWGAWHLGSVTSAGLAALGHDVLVTDIDDSNLERLAEGAAPILEPGLDELIKQQAATGRLRVVPPRDPALGNAAFTFIAADTPVDDNDQASLAQLDQIISAIAKVLTKPTVLVVATQVPVGTCHRLAGDLAHQTRMTEISVVCLPENLRLGAALESFFKPDRLVIGADDQRSGRRAQSLFSKLDCPFLMMSIPSAEMAKHSLNTFLATCISFSSQISDICEVVGAEARDVVAALRSDRRVSQHAPLAPGLGFGGGTLGRDLIYLIEAARKRKIPVDFLEAVRATNDRRLPMLVDRISQMIGSLRGATVALLGLVYKPGTDTLRRSQSVDLARLLSQDGAAVRGHDPAIKKERAGDLGFVVCADAYEAASGADLLVLMTEWPDYRNIDLDRLAAAMRRRMILDPKAFLDRDGLLAARFEYQSLGSPIGPGNSSREC